MNYRKVLEQIATVCHCEGSLIAQAALDGHPYPTVQGSEQMISRHQFELTASEIEEAIREWLTEHQDVDLTSDLEVDIDWKLKDDFQFQEVPEMRLRISWEDKSGEDKAEED